MTKIDEMKEALMEGAIPVDYLSVFKDKGNTVYIHDPERTPAVHYMHNSTLSDGRDVHIHLLTGGKDMYDRLEIKVSHSGEKPGFITTESRNKGLTNYRRLVTDNVFYDWSIKSSGGYSALFVDTNPDIVKTEDWPVTTHEITASYEKLVDELIAIINGEQVTLTVLRKLAN